MKARTLRGPLGWSIVSFAVILVFCIYAVFTISSPFFSTATINKSESKTNTLVEMYNKQVAVDIARFNGRSAFFKPIRIAPPTPPPSQAVETIPTPQPVITTPPPGPPPPPATYMGPQLIAIIGDEAWFRSSGTSSEAVIRLKIGEEKDGLKLVKTTLPSMVTVEHRRGEYVIDLFTNDEPFFRQDPPPIVSDSFLKEVEG